MLKARRISDNNKFIEKPPLKTIVIRPVWLCGCVFFKTQLQPFGYKKKKSSILFTGSHIFCVGNAIFAKQELLAFFALFT
jgi:hypothetical protein